MAISGESVSVRELVMGNDKSFYIPIYQRAYTWSAKQQVEKLLEDILDFAEEYRDNPEGEYYIGNIILKEQSEGFAAEQLVVDGQQRITTTVLMLCAIRDIYLEGSGNQTELRSARVIGRALYSDDGDVIRIKLNNMEHQKTLNLLLSGHLDAIGATDRPTNYWRNYQHIRYDEPLPDFGPRATGDWSTFPAFSIASRS